MTYRLPSILAGLTALEPVNLPLDGQIDRRFTKRITRMTDPKAIDISPEAVASRIAKLRAVPWPAPSAASISFDAKTADLLSALSAALSEARGKVGEADQNAEAMEAKWRALTPHGTCACSMDSPDDVCLHHSPKLADAIAQRDAALSELARLKAALTPSADTKAEYIGEFKFAITGDNEDGSNIETVTVPWTTTKEIMARILAYALPSPPKDPAK